MQGTRRLLAAVAGAGVLGSLALVSAAPASATFAGDDGVIAFGRVDMSVFPAQYDIWSVDPDAPLTEVRLTTSHKAENPQWSRDGSTICYEDWALNGSRHIYTMNADGSDQRLITPASTHAVNCSWLPNGEIAFDNGGGNVYAVNPITGAQRTLLGGPERDSMPSFSDDGQYMVAIRRTFNPNIAELVRYDADGTNPVVLASQPTIGTVNDKVSWTPDSGAILWSVLDQNNTQRQYLVDVEGGTQEMLGHGQPGTTGIGLDPHPYVRGWDVSPQGDRFVLTSHLNGVVLWLTDADGNLTTRLTSAPSVNDRQAAWQPLGNVNDGDTTDPTVTIASPVAGNIEQGSAVTIDYTATDENLWTTTANIDGDIVYDGDPLPTSELGEYTLTVTAMDTSGNTTVASVTYNVIETVVLDTTDPVITVASPSTNDVLIDGNAVADFSATDEGGSGLASVTATYDGEPVADGDTLDTSAIGTKTLVVTAVDNAGNETVTEVSFRVIWPLGNFTGPIDPMPTVNSVKAGQTVPARFSLGGDRGLDILAGAPTVRRVDCASGVSVDPIEEVVASSPGNNALSYDPATGLYSYNWKTDKGWSNTCRTMSFTFDDGQTLTASFRFTR